MKQYHLWTFGVLWILLLLMSAPLCAQSVAVGELIAESKQYDKKEVAIEGEAIGHLMRRSDYAWLNVLDVDTSIGVWAPINMFETIKHFGRHRIVGDRIRVRGIFHASCSVHGGDTDIHVQALEVIAWGNEQYEAPNPKKKQIIGVLIGILVCLYIIKILRKRR